MEGTTLTSSSQNFFLFPSGNKSLNLSLRARLELTHRFLENGSIFKHLEETTDMVVRINILVSNLPEVLLEKEDLDTRELGRDVWNVLDDFAEDEVCVQVLFWRLWEELIESFGD